MASLKANSREVTGKKVKQLRADGKIPASVYGPKTDPVSVSIDPVKFKKLFDEVGYSALFELNVDEAKSFKALIKEVQIDPLNDIVLHVSIYQVDMTKSINADIPVVIEGKSPAVKNNIGLLVTPVNTITVQCLPENLPSEFVINIDALAQVGDSITVGSVELPEGVELEHGMSEDSLLAYISAPQKAIEDEPAEDEGDDEEKEDGEEGGAEEGEDTED